MVLDINGNEHKLLYLDTNALSEMISNNKNFCENINKKFAKKNYCISFSFYNVLELANGYKKRYDEFIKIFSVIPCILFMPYKDIIKEEVDVHNGNLFDIRKISLSFVPGLGKNYDINYFLNEAIPTAQSTMKKEKESYNKLCKFFSNQKDNEKEFVIYNNQYEEMKTIDFLNTLKYKIKTPIDIEKLPACRMINISTYNRIVNGKKIPIEIGDINDIMISTVTPYVDVVITEKYQKSIIDKAKKYINQIKNIDCYKVSDFYDLK